LSFNLEGTIRNLADCLGQDSNHRIALKVGGKPIGMGTITVDVLGIDVWTENTQMQQDFESVQNLGNRYYLTS